MSDRRNSFAVKPMPRHVGLFLQLADELEELARSASSSAEAWGIRCGLRMAAHLAKKKHKLTTGGVL